MKTKLIPLIIIAICLPIVAGCGNSADLRPVEEEQIENVVKDYYVRNTEIPEQEVTIEASTAEWARVSIRPAATDQNSDVASFYLQKQDHISPDIPVEDRAQPGNQASDTTTTGWSIVLGPQVNFTDAELDGAGVPEAVRP